MPQAKSIVYGCTRAAPTQGLMFFLAWEIAGPTSAQPARSTHWVNRLILFAHWGMTKRHLPMACRCSISLMRTTTIRARRKAKTVI